MGGGGVPGIGLSRERHYLEVYQGQELGISKGMSRGWRRSEEVPCLPCGYSQNTAAAPPGHRYLREETC